VAAVACMAHCIATTIAILWTHCTVTTNLCNIITIASFLVLLLQHLLLLLLFCFLHHRWSHPSSFYACPKQSQLLWKTLCCLLHHGHVCHPTPLYGPVFIHGTLPNQTQGWTVTCTTSHSHIKQFLCCSLQTSCSNNMCCYDKWCHTIMQVLCPKDLLQHLF